MNPGVIPLTEMKAYIELFDVLDKELFVILVRTLDSIFIERLSNSGHGTRGKS